MIRVICDYCLWRIIEDDKKYKLIMYADAKYKKPIVKLLSFIDVTIEKFVSDMPCEDEKSVYDLLFEDKSKIVILVCKDDFQTARGILEGMGLQLGISFKDINHYCSESGSMPYVYDPMMGYNLETKDMESRGFRVFGDLHGKGLRILTLGGSTTDAYIYPLRSWSEWLHDEMTERGIANTVICGGVAGYRSSEEMLKLIRDGFILSPDIVINYSGYNDCFLQEYPYINDYMREICSYINQTMESKDIYQDNWTSKSTGGINGDFSECIEKMYQFWITNQRMIHAICQVHGVKHMTCLQPSLFNGKKWLSDYERSYALNLVYISGKRYKRGDLEYRVKAFRELAQEDIARTEWLYDLSEVLDNEDAYIDMCHLNENGNRIIARKIAEILVSRSCQ